MKNINAYDSTANFNAAYFGNAYIEPWVSISRNETVVTKFTGSTQYDGDKTFTLVKRIPIAKGFVISGHDVNINHTDYIYVWEMESSGGGGIAMLAASPKGVTKASTGSSGENTVVTLRGDFSNTTQQQDVDIFEQGDGKRIDYKDSYTFTSISDVVTEQRTGLHYSKRLGNIKYHMSYNLADYDSTNYRIPVTFDFDPDDYMYGDDEIYILATVTDGTIVRDFLCTMTYENFIQSSFDIKGDYYEDSLIGFIMMYNGQYYISMGSSGGGGGLAK